MKKKIFFILIIIVLLFLLGLGIFWVKDENEKKSNTGDIIVKDNVYTITEDSELEDTLIEVTENQLVFSKNPKYKEGDIIVAGVIDEAEDGFIRRVLKSEKKKGEYIIETEPAVLTDVFEKANIEKQFRLTDNGVEEYIGGEAQAKVTNEPYRMKRVVYNTKKNDTYSVVELSDVNANIKTPEYIFQVSLEQELDDIATVRGETDFGIWVELDLKINYGDVIFEVVAHTETGASVSLTFSEEMQKEIKKVLFEKGFPNITFVVGGIPIVVTNDLEVLFDAEFKKEGTIGVNYEVSSENAYGFVYDSRKDNVSEVKEEKSDTDGMKWTTMEVSGTESATVSVHLVTKLYGATGADIGIGIQGTVEGEAKVSVNPELSGYAGRLGLSIAPKVEGKVIVEIPIVDRQLVGQTIFEKELKPFWEEEWKSSANWKADLEWTATGEKGNTYITRFGEVNLVSYPAFQFDIPFGWDIVTEQVTESQEIVTIANERGVTITFSQLDIPVGDKATGGSGVTMNRVNATRVADSSFVPGYVQALDMSGMGTFCVAELKVTGELSMQTDTEYTDIDGKVAYAVIPESQLGEKDVRNLYCVDFGFNYSAGDSFIAESPDGKFTKKEEKQVIEILQSFKLAE